MISSVLVVCIGNVCRSPVGERLLAQACPNLVVESAGLGAPVGHAIDKDAASIAGAAGVEVENHSARQFTGELASKYDLILVMEKSHLKSIAAENPQLSGKAMLFSHWVGAAEIPDPHKRSIEFHQEVFKQLQAASAGWAEKLAKK